MAKIKYTKNELKQQKDALKRYSRYLPMLLLKKQQLQMEMRRVTAEIIASQGKRDKLLEDMQPWLAVLAEEVGLPELVKVEAVDTSIGNIAGVEIPVFNGITLAAIEYDIFAMPLWVDRAVIALKQLLTQDAEISVLTKEHSLLHDELRTTSQRVNLFEKVKIPETRENIRTIQIYLGDEQTAAVVRGKIAKGRL